MDSLRRDQKGISLLEILLAIAIVGAMLLYLTRMIRVADTGNKVNEGLERMELIAFHLKAFYRGHLVLPDPAVDPRNPSGEANTVPLGTPPLDLSPKYRLDPWGNSLRYYCAERVAPTGKTRIRGLRVNGREAAGVLISLGPNQIQDYTVNQSATPQEFTSAGDDLLVPIILEEEAWEIALEELEFLNKRVAAYDRLFAGVDNDGHDYPYVVAPRENPPEPWDPYPSPTEASYRLVDEAGCNAQPIATNLRGGLRCLLHPNYFRNMSFDPNCGRAILDQCQGSDALDDILELYAYEAGAGLNVARYRTDPWGNAYQWGFGPLVPYRDRRYHVFFSTGPDGRPFDGTRPVGPENLDDDITSY